MKDDAEVLIARLLAARWLSRDDPLARRALVDESFREQVDARLGHCGLRLLDNPYAAHLAVALAPDMEEPVFGGADRWESNNLGLARDCTALLVVLWALLILPKRERQIARRDVDDAPQGDMFGTAKAIRTGAEVSGGIAETALLADFGAKLGGKTRVNFNLGILARHGFIERRKETIYEGPLLDLAIDYAVFAPRILDGALAALLAQRAANDAAPDAPAPSPLPE